METQMLDFGSYIASSDEEDEATEAINSSHHPVETKNRCNIASEATQFLALDDDDDESGEGIDEDDSPAAISRAPSAKSSPAASFKLNFQLNIAGSPLVSQPLTNFDQASCSRSADAAIATDIRRPQVYMMETQMLDWGNDHVENENDENDNDCRNVYKQHAAANEPRSSVLEATQLLVLDGDKNDENEENEAEIVNKADLREKTPTMSMVRQKMIVCSDGRDSTGRSITNPAPAEDSSASLKSPPKAAGSWDINVDTFTRTPTVPIAVLLPSTATPGESRTAFDVSSPSSSVDLRARVASMTDVIVPHRVNSEKQARLGQEYQPEMAAKGKSSSVGKARSLRAAILDSDTDSDVGECATVAVDDKPFLKTSAVAAGDGRSVGLGLSGFAVGVIDVKAGCDGDDDNDTDVDESMYSTAPTDSPGSSTKNLGRTSLTTATTPARTAIPTTAVVACGGSKEEAFQRRPLSSSVLSERSRMLVLTTPGECSQAEEEDRGDVASQADSDESIDLLAPALEDVVESPELMRYSESQEGGRKDRDEVKSTETPSRPAGGYKEELEDLENVEMKSEGQLEKVLATSTGVSGDGEKKKMEGESEERIERNSLGIIEAPKESSSSMALQASSDSSVASVLTNFVPSSPSLEVHKTTATSPPHGSQSMNVAVDDSSSNHIEKCDHPLPNDDSTESTAATEKKKEVTELLEREEDIEEKKTVPTSYHGRGKKRGRDVDVQQTERTIGDNEDKDEDKDENAANACRASKSQYVTTSVVSVSTIPESSSSVATKAKANDPDDNDSKNIDNDKTPCAPSSVSTSASGRRGKRRRGLQLVEEHEGVQKDEVVMDVCEDGKEVGATEEKKGVQTTKEEQKGLVARAAVVVDNHAGDAGDAGQVVDVSVTIEENDMNKEVIVRIEEEEQVVNARAKKSGRQTKARKQSITATDDDSKANKMVSPISEHQSFVLPAVPTTTTAATVTVPFTTSTEPSPLIKSSAEITSKRGRRLTKTDTQTHEASVLTSDSAACPEVDSAVTSSPAPVSVQTDTSVSSDSAVASAVPVPSVAAAKSRARKGKTTGKETPDVANESSSVSVMSLSSMNTVAMDIVPSSTASAVNSDEAYPKEPKPIPETAVVTEVIPPVSSIATAEEGTVKHNSKKKMKPTPVPEPVPTPFSSSTDHSVSSSQTTGVAASTSSSVSSSVSLVPLPSMTTGKSRGTKASSKDTGTASQEVQSASSSSSSMSSPSTSVNAGPTCPAPPPIDVVRIIFSGIEKECELAEAIGAAVVDRPEEATHMIVGDTLKRTPKLMVALNSGVRYVLRLKWLEDSAKAGKPIAIPSLKSKYIVQDRDKEALWGFSMAETLAKPRDRECVFSGCSFIVADGVCGQGAPPEEDMRAIITSGDGEFVESDMGAWRLGEECEGRRVYVIATQAVVTQGGIEGRLRALIESGAVKGPYSPELVFLAVLRQVLGSEDDNKRHLIPLPASVVPAEKTRGSRGVNVTNTNKAKQELNRNSADTRPRLRQHEISTSEESEKLLPSNAKKELSRGKPSSGASAARKVATARKEALQRSDDKESVHDNTAASAVPSTAFSCYADDLVGKVAYEDGVIHGKDDFANNNDDDNDTDVDESLYSTAPTDSPGSSTKNLGRTSLTTATTPARTVIPAAAGGGNIEGDDRTSGSKDLVFVPMTAPTLSSTTVEVSEEYKHENISEQSAVPTHGTTGMTATTKEKKKKVKELKEEEEEEEKKTVPTSYHGRGKKRGRDVDAQQTERTIGDNEDKVEDEDVTNAGSASTSHSLGTSIVPVSLISKSSSSAITEDKAIDDGDGDNKNSNIGNDKTPCAPSSVSTSASGRRGKRRRDLQLVEEHEGVRKDEVAMDVCEDGKEEGATEEKKEEQATKEEKEGLGATSTAVDNHTSDAGDAGQVVDVSVTIEENDMDKEVIVRIEEEEQVVNAKGKKSGRQTKAKKQYITATDDDSKANKKVSPISEHQSIVLPAVPTTITAATVTDTLTTSTEPSSLIKSSAEVTSKRGRRLTKTDTQAHEASMLSSASAACQEVDSAITSLPAPVSAQTDTSVSSDSAVASAVPMPSVSAAKSRPRKNKTTGKETLVAANESSSVSVLSLSSMNTAAIDIPLSTASTVNSDEAYPKPKPIPEAEAVTEVTSPVSSIAVDIPLHSSLTVVEDTVKHNNNKKVKTTLVPEPVPNPFSSSTDPSVSSSQTTAASAAVPSSAVPLPSLTTGKSRGTKATIKDTGTASQEMQSSTASSSSSSSMSSSSTSINASPACPAPPPVDVVRIIFSGIEKECELADAIGAAVVDRPEEATHMIVGDTLKRTPKLMVALNSGVRYVLRLKWLEDSAKAGKPIAIPSLKSKYIVQDRDKETLWGFSMAETLAKPRDRERVFSGCSFIVADGVCGQGAPPEEDMRAIITSGDGEFVESDMGARRLSEEHEGRRVYVIATQAVVAQGIEGRLRALIESGAVKGPYSPELVFLAVLRQVLGSEEDNKRHLIPLPATSMGSQRKKGGKK